MENKILPIETITNKELPRESAVKSAPKETLISKIIPHNSELKTEKPEETKLKIEKPQETPIVEETPTESPLVETQPEPTPEKEEKPSEFLEENCVMVGEHKVEIKPTKLKYFRNKAASAYNVIKSVPLHELMVVGKGVFDEKRDADQLMFDFLVSAFDDAEFVKENYDNFDADNIERVVKIFGRLNHIDEKEEAIRKNREAQAQAKR